MRTNCTCKPGGNTSPIETKENDETISIADSLLGIISDSGMTLEELREERLKKYDD